MVPQGHGPLKEIGWRSTPPLRDIFIIKPIYMMYATNMILSRVEALIVI
jgi:hypothetical protein